MNDSIGDLSIEQALHIALQHHRAGRLTDAEAIYRNVLAIAPNNAAALEYLGAIAIQTGHYAVAVELMQQAAGLKPPGADLLSNLGMALWLLGRFEEAEQNCREALALKPDFAMAKSNLGNVQASLGKLLEAEQSYREALVIQPDFSQAQNNLGNVLQSLGRTQEAAQNYRRAVELMPGFTEAHYNLGNALQNLDQLQAAEQSYRRALELRPDLAIAHYSIGNVQKAFEQFEEAERSYRRALELKPNYIEALFEWVFQRRQLCDWQGLELSVQALRRHVNEAKSSRFSPWIFLTLPETEAMEQYDCARKCAESEWSLLLGRPPLYLGGSRSEGPRLRLGFLSSDFREHATSYLLAEIIELFDRNRFEVFGYSYGLDDQSPMRHRMQSAFDTFRDVRALTNDAAAQQILADDIDVLVDLKGYTTDARMQIAALRPAPVQVSWLGYPGTLGHSRLADYLIGDPIVTPLANAAHFSETLALMPHCYQPNDRRREISRLPTRAEAGLPNQGIVFCCFNQAYKITVEVFDLWCHLLASVSGSVMWLLEPVPAAQFNLRREASARGVAPERLIFAPRQPQANHLARIQLADLALDTFPCTSHTTASDALWAGVPLVTMIGNTFVSRVAASILHAASLPELVTYNSDSYYELAYELGANPAKLMDVRTKLARKRVACPLFDSERFTRDLEKLFERIQRAHRDGRKTPFLVGE